MIYAVSDASCPAEFLSVGNLVNDNHFLHPGRTLDSYELICVTEGVLYIQADCREHEIGPGQFLVLFPGECHYGRRPTDGPLSFYWTHFLLTASDTRLPLA